MPGNDIRAARVPFPLRLLNQAGLANNRHFEQERFRTLFPDL
jgi:hypothetical protein